MNAIREFFGVFFMLLFITGYSFAKSPPSPETKSGAHLYFIECSGKTIKYFIDSKTKKQLVNSDETVVADAEFNAFLKTVKRDTNGQLVFMLRQDGWSGYERVVGWAMENYGFEPHDISKMAVPGSGDIDVSSFGSLPATSLMPKPRPIPENANIRHIWITSNAVISHLADPNFKKELGNTLKKYASESGLSGPKVEFDTNKLDEYLKKNFYPKFEDLNFSSANSVPWTDKISFMVTPNLSSVTLPFNEQLKMGSKFYNILKEINSKDDQKGVVFFHVAEGGMDNYVRAKEIADRLHIKVAWDMRLAPDLKHGDQPWNELGIRDFEGVTYTRKVTATAPPPGPPQKPTPDTRLIKGRAGSTLD